MFGELIRRVEALGVSTEVTLYRLFLGDQDSTTGHYRKGFTIDTITEVHFPRGTAISVGALGYYTRYEWTGFTDNEALDLGDVVLDSFGRYFEVQSKRPWHIADQQIVYELEMEQLAVFPFLAGFFGFEDEEHGLIGYGFEDGFERGYWAL